jgi:hypothetical protein
MSDSEVVAESVALTYASSVLIQVWTWTMDSPKANNKHNRLSSIDWQLHNSVASCYDNYDHGFMREMSVQIMRA